MKSAQNGILITFEGTEGAGKTTLIRQIAMELETQGIPRSKLTLTREPGGSPVAEKIRAVILEEAMDPWTELFLYEASRAEHVAKVLRPALERGQIVLCDRYADSSLAYQGHARGLPWKSVERLNDEATQGLKPKLTVFLDVDPGMGLRRATEKNRFELEGVEFQKRVRAGFLKAAKAQPTRWLIVKPRERSPQQIALDVIGHLRKKKWLKQ